MILSFKNVLIVSIVIIFIGVTAIFGLKAMTVTLSTETSSNGEIILEKVFNETFKLTMIIPKDTYALGEPVNITLKLTNIGDENVTIHHGWGIPLNYLVLNQTGSEIYNSQWVTIVLMVRDETTLEPNMSIEKSFTWKQVSIDYPLRSFQEYPVSTGTYYIVGFTAFDDGFSTLHSALPPAEIQII